MQILKLCLITAQKFQSKRDDSEEKCLHYRMFHHKFFTDNKLYVIGNALGGTCGWNDDAEIRIIRI